MRWIQKVIITQKELNSAALEEIFTSFFFWQIYIAKGLSSA